MYNKSNYRKKSYFEAGKQRWEDAKVLASAGNYEGACYMAGYTVEMTLKYIIFVKRGCDVVENYSELTPTEYNDLVGNNKVSYKNIQYTSQNLGQLFNRLNRDKIDKIYTHDLYELLKFLDESFSAGIGYATFSNSYDKINIWSEQWRYQIEDKFPNIAIDKNFAQQFFQQVNDFFDQLERLSLLTTGERKRLLKIVI